MNYNDISNNILIGNSAGVIEGIQELIDLGNQPLEIINEGLMAGMSIVGERFKNGEMFVPEVMMSARAMNEGLNLVKPLINDEDIPSVGTIVIGTVKGDLHDIGKNLVSMMLESSGFKVIDVGIDVSKEKFIEAVKNHNANIVAMSAMLTTTMVYMKEVIKALDEAGLRNQVKIMLGGAPVTQKFSDEIGADLYTVDASSAAEEAKKLVA